MANSSKKRSQPREAQSCDRFSSLSDEIVHEILCYLPFKHLARTALVSKRLKKLCLSTPDVSLNFDSYYSEPPMLINGAKLRRFAPTGGGPETITKWIHHATTVCNATQLDISFKMPAKHCLTTSDSLQCLMLWHCKFERVTVAAERLHTFCFHECSSSDDSLFRIYAPRLEKISWVASWYNVKGTILCFEKSADINDPNHLVTTAPDETRNLLQLLQFLNRAKSVTLTNSVLEKLHANGLVEFMLDNVENFDLQIGRMDCKMTSLASFFGRLPNMMILTIRCMESHKKCSSHSFRYNGWSLEAHIKYWEDQCVPFINRLKQVCIEIHHWGFEIGFVCFLIKKVKALDKMIAINFASSVDSVLVPDAYLASTITKFSTLSRLISEILLEFYAFYDATFDFVLK